MPKRTVCSDCGQPAWGQTCQPCRRRSRFAVAGPCPTCGAPLSDQQIMHGGEYCSISCSARAKKTGRRRPLRQCEQCGVEFARTHGRAEKPQRFCSVKCRGIATRAANPKSSRIYPRRCAQCAEWFLARAARTKYCSRRCGYEFWYAGAYQRKPTPSSRECRRCGKSFSPLTNRNVYCSRKCSWRDADDRRSARKREAYVADVWRSEIYSRDSYKCQLCGKRLAMSKKAPHPKSPTIDHIIPISQGGTHEPANVQAAHFLCNSRKGARAANEQLLLIG